MAGKNSNKVNDKEKKKKEKEKKKEKKEELGKERIWKAIGAFDNICLNYLEIKSESRRRSLWQSLFKLFRNQIWK